METPTTQEIQDAARELDLERLAKELGLGRKKPIPIPPSYDVVVEAGNQYLPQDKLLYYYTYLTGQRISEVLSTRRLDLKLRTVDGKEFMIVDSITLKNKDQPRRELPVPLFGLEEPIARTVWNAVKDLRMDLNLFPISRQQAFNHLNRQSIYCGFIHQQTKQRFEGMLPIYPHFLRHCRATHLISEHGYSKSDLQDYFGWATPTMPNLYASSSWRHLAGQLIHK